MAGVPDHWVWRTPLDPDYGKYGVGLPRPLHVYLEDRQTGQVAKFVNFVPPQEAAAGLAAAGGDASTP